MVFGDFLDVNVWILLIYNGFRIYLIIELSFVIKVVNVIFYLL